MQYVGTLPVLHSGRKRPFTVFERSHLPSGMRHNEASLHWNRLLYWCGHN